MLNVAPQKERISDHLRAMAEQDDKSAAGGKTGEQSTIGVGCAPGEERGAAIGICAIHSPAVTAAVAEYCEDSVEKQKALTEVQDGLVDLTTRLASLACRPMRMYPALTRRQRLPISGSYWYFAMSISQLCAGSRRRKLWLSRPFSGPGCGSSCGATPVP